MKLLRRVICVLLFCCSVKSKEVIGSSKYTARTMNGDTDNEEFHVEVKKVFEDADGQEYYDLVGLDETLKLVLQKSNRLVTEDAELIRTHDKKIVSREKLKDLHHYVGYIQMKPTSTISVKVKDGFLSGIIVTDRLFWTIAGIKEPSHGEHGLKHVIKMTKHEKNDLKHVMPGLNSVRRRRHARSKRATETKLYMAGMLVADHSTAAFHGDNTESYLMLVADLLNAVYQDSSIGDVKVVYLLSQMRIATGNDLNYTVHNADDSTKVLSLFRKWALQFQDHNESSTRNFDNAALVTKQICGTTPCSINGRGYYHGMCGSTSISTGAASGIGAGIILAHEIGHNFGLGHDSGSCAKGYIMHSGIYGSANAYRWSPCSRTRLQQWFSNPRKFKCLYNIPKQDLKTIDTKTMGKRVSANEQCQLMYGQEYTQCGSLKGSCTLLYCYKPGGRVCYHRGIPPLEGTSCGVYKWCQSGLCVHEPIPAPRDGGWGNWSEFSNCTTSCGMGVRYRTRECNNPSPAFFGKPCVGDARGYYETCNTHDCPSGTPTYRDVQCKERRSTSVGYVDGAICLLRCRISSVVHYYGVVRDGTRCDNDKHNYDVCVMGKCKKVDCARKFSHLRLDRCGICDKSGNTCKLVSNTVTLSPGLRKSITFLTLPVGSFNLWIEEQTATYNDIGVKDAKGDWLIAPKKTSRTIYAAGAKIVYTRSASKVKDTLSITGPITEELQILASRWYESRLYVKYRYYEPIDPPSDLGTVTFYWGVDIGSCSETCAGGIQETIGLCYRADDNSSVSNSNCNPNTNPTTSSPCNTQPCELRWEIGAWSACSATCGPYGNRTRKVECRQRYNSTYDKLFTDDQCTGQKATTLEECNRVDCSPDWEPGPWSKCSREKCQGMQTRVLYCRKLLATGAKTSLSDNECVTNKPITELICNPNIKCFVWEPVFDDCSHCVQENLAGLTYTKVGCYKLKTNLFGNQALGIFPGEGGADTVQKCGVLAHERARSMFAVDNDGNCYSSLDGHEIYYRGGRSDSCDDYTGTEQNTVLVYGINGAVLVSNHSCFSVENDTFVEDSYCTDPRPNPVLKLCCEEVCLGHCFPTEDGGYCAIPFIHNGREWYDCVRDGNNKPWCATTSNYDIDKQKANCQEPCRSPTVTKKCCSFPFIYRGRLYNTCIKCQNCDQLWCSLTSNYDRDGLGEACAVK